MPVPMETDLAIRELYGRAVQLFDRADAAWVECWAKDPEFAFPADPAAGRPGFSLTSHEQLAGMVVQANQMMEHRGLHHFTNLTFDQVDDGVQVRGYLLLVKTGAGPMEPGLVMQNTRIDDLVVQEDGQWKFKRRTVGALWS